MATLTSPPPPATPTTRAAGKVVRGPFTPESRTVRQTTFSVTLPVKPESRDRLAALITDFRHQVEQTAAGEIDQYERFFRNIPTLHFMSITVFPSADYDPLLVIEVNIDGPPGVFWGQADALIAEDLRAMLRCCKRPRDAAAAMFDAVVAPGSKSMVAPYLEARSTRPSVFHHGNRGLGRQRILAERALFAAIRTEFLTAQDGAKSPYREVAAAEVQARLRTALLPAFPWLDTPAAPRIGAGDRIADWLRLLLFIAAVIAVLAFPGWLVSRIAGGHHDLLYALLSIPVMLGLIVAWLRVLEKHDASHDAPAVDEAAIREMAQREDRIPQNHMGSIVLLKPGILRTIIVHAGHLGLGLALRVTATDGYLGSMRTVHFAHWAFVDNGSRLMFLSNFDQSWESYLDDFIEKAHVGLTLAWGCGVGFPPTRFLVGEGATNGRQFKAWARHSMAASQFWYSAYQDLTVNQIERNALIADGLRRGSLDAQKAGRWIVLL